MSLLSSECCCLPLELRVILRGLIRGNALLRVCTFGKMPVETIVIHSSKHVKRVRSKKDEQKIIKHSNLACDVILLE